jgi:hypothetical protein
VISIVVPPAKKSLADQNYPAIYGRLLCVPSKRFEPTSAFRGTAFFSLSLLTAAYVKKNAIGHKERKRQYLWQDLASDMTPEHFALVVGRARI